jgi:hypothetical protein
LSRRCCFRRKSFRSHSAGGGKRGGVAWSSKNLHPKNDPTLRPGHSKPFPQLQTTASRFAPSNFGEDARGPHGRGSLLHRASVGRHGQIHDGQRLSPFHVLPRGPVKGLTEHRIRASRVKPTELDTELGRPQRPSNLKTSEFLPAEVESRRVMTQPERPMVAIYVRNSAGRCVQCNRSSARRRCLSVMRPSDVWSRLATQAQHCRWIGASVGVATAGASPAPAVVFRPVSIVEPTCGVLVQPARKLKARPMSSPD